MHLQLSIQSFKSNSPFLFVFSQTKARRADRIIVMNIRTRNKTLKG
jgi:hypothetical protein